MLPTILITGANGQVGTVLATALRRKYGVTRVITSDLHPPKQEVGHFVLLDATDADRLTRLVRDEGVTQIYHLAAILSATGELNPGRTWRVNMDAWLNVLEVARQESVDRVFFPSSIAVFGPGADLSCTPNQSVLDPTTVYGITKAAGENWAQYYFERYGLDVRSLRYPGVIGHQSLPGGGTTDYAVEVFHYALRRKPYSCFLKPDARLPMMYMDDAIRATLEIMEAPAERIRVRTSYNIAGCSFTPAEIVAAVRRLAPSLDVTYDPDFRQGIAESWPETIDDSAARNDWGWQPNFDLGKLCHDMFDNLSRQDARLPDHSLESPYLA